MLCCIRTTINFDDDLLRRVKAEAVRRGHTLTSVIEDALRAELARRDAAEVDSQTFRITPFDGNGLQPGVDLDDSVALLDLMEED
ncbi:MAG: hypothetical protein ACRDWA_06885 [Acidimicrobiia bacterium]